MSGQRVVTNPTKSVVDGSLVLIYAVPITDNGQVVGMLSAVKDGYLLCDTIGDITFGKSGKAFMIDREGTTVAHSDKALVTNMDNDFKNIKKDPLLKALVKIEKKMVNGEQGIGEYQYRGTVKYIGYAPVANVQSAFNNLAINSKDVLEFIDKRVHSDYELLVETGHSF